MTDSVEKNTAYDPTKKQKAFDKVSRIPVKVEHSETLKKPEWIRVKAILANALAKVRPRS